MEIQKSVRIQLQVIKSFIKSFPWREPVFVELIFQLILYLEMKMVVLLFVITEQQQSTHSL